MLSVEAQTQSPEWQAVAQSISAMRAYEEGGPNNDWYRDINEYLIALDGLRVFFQYAKSLGLDATVVDVGAGSLEAIDEISKTRMARGVKIKATILGQIPDMTVPERVTVLTTPVEVLDGVEDSSVSGMFGVCSVAYSGSPRLAVDTIDRKLKPGAPFKGVFRPKGNDLPTPNGTNYQTHDAFSARFRELGYDVAIKPNLGDTHRESIMLAVKPGGTMTAAELLRLDSGAANQFLHMDGLL